MTWTQLFIWLCISMWRELLCLLLCPRACEMRVNRLLTSLWGPWGLLTRQSLCLTAIDGPWRWQCIHKPLWCDHQCHFFCWGCGTNCPYAFLCLCCHQVARHLLNTVVHILQLNDNLKSSKPLYCYLNYFILGYHYGNKQKRKDKVQYHVLNSLNCAGISQVLAQCMKVQH